MKQFTSFDDAHQTNDYPYSFTLRCDRREWVETALKGAKKGQQRFVTCTRNPKTGAWNKPKSSTYYLFLVMTDETTTGHITYDTISEYDSTDHAQNFLDKHHAVMSEARIKWLEYWIGQKRKVDEGFENGTLKWVINGTVQN